MELGSLHLHRPTPPPAEEGEQGEARGEEGEGRGFGHAKLQAVEINAIVSTGMSKANRCKISIYDTEKKKVSIRELASAGIEQFRRRPKRFTKKRKRYTKSTRSRDPTNATRIRVAKI